MSTSMTPVHSFNDMLEGSYQFKCKCKSKDINEPNSAGPLEEKSASGWSDFAQDTTMHGIRYVNVSGSPKTARLAWLLAILICIGLGVLTTESFFTAYFRKDTSTRFKNIQEDELVLPKIVICDHNRFKRSAVEAAIDKYNLTGLDMLLQRRFSYTEFPAVDWNEPQFDNLRNLTGESLVDLIFEMAPKPSETFYYMFFGGQMLDLDQHIEMIMTDMGICYQINGNGTFATEDAGLANGLSFSLNVYPKDYYIGYFAQSTGMSLILYDQYDTPRVATDALTGVRPGTHVDLSIYKSKIKRAAPPADNNMADCFDSENLPNTLQYYQNYSFNACVNEVRATAHQDICGCRDFFDSPIEGIPLCNASQQISCMLNIEWSDYKDYDLKELCPIPCAQTHYKTQMALYDYPNHAYFSNAYGLTREMTDSIAEEQISMMIFYSSMSYDYLEEYIPYTWKDVLANLGGTLGLCIGASLLTFVEFFQFGFGACVNAWNRRRMRKTNSSTAKLVHAAS